MNITISTAKRIISSLVQQQLDGKNPPPVFLWGPPGVGKSDIMRQVAAEKGIDDIIDPLIRALNGNIVEIPLVFRGLDAVYADFDGQILAGLDHGVLRHSGNAHHHRR